MTAFDLLIFGLASRFLPWILLTIIYLVVTNCMLWHLKMYCNIGWLRMIWFIVYTRFLQIIWRAFDYNVKYLLMIHQTIYIIIRKNETPKTQNWNNQSNENEISTSYEFRICNIKLSMYPVRGVWSNWYFTFSSQYIIPSKF